MAKKLQTFIGRARSWTTKQGLHGPAAFRRFVMMIFVERLNQVSDDFVFKGGNLLWIYIKTPRATIDLDFATKQIESPVEVEEILKKACKVESDGLKFTLKSFLNIDRSDGNGAAVRLEYKTEEGQHNEFDIDVVYASPTLMREIPSPLTEGVKILAATVENIVADKISASYRFKSGNTRMKDFDDLWRISKADAGLINWTALSDLLERRKIPAELDKKWINPVMNKNWAAHTRENPNLPSNLDDLINEVNAWLGKRLG